MDGNGEDFEAFRGRNAEEKPQNALVVPRWVPRERSEEDRLKPGGPEDAAGEEPTRVLMVGGSRRQRFGA